MMSGVVVVLAAVAMTFIGLGGAAWGIVTTLRAHRPASLGAALVAALSLALALLGMTGLLVPGFF
jgi:hypothetical protein